MKKVLLWSLLEKIVNRQFLLVLLNIFLFPIFSNAQGVETAVQASLLKFMQYV
jgi:hypothetical protein